VLGSRKTDVFLELVRGPPPRSLDNLKAEVLTNTRAVALPARIERPLEIVFREKLGSF
jgi:hypothetical protein